MASSNKRRTVVASGGLQVLPDEVMTEIFLRLPINSILRFRAVCRSWAAVLSSEEFCSLHMAKVEAVSSPPKLFFTSPTTGFDGTEVYLGSSSGPGDGLLFTLKDVRGDFVEMMPAPCRGLTLLYDMVAPAYYVFNAATRAVTRLPPFTDVDYATAGLAFDVQTKEYKVVRLFCGDQGMRCEIYTLGGEQGDCWRAAVGGLPFRFYKAAFYAICHATSCKFQPVFANGFLNWLIHPDLIVKRPRAAILSFSVVDESFKWVQSPPFVVSDVHLVELAGNLCMVRDLCNVSPGCSMLEIWKLNDFNSGGWSLQHRIDLLQHLARELIEPQILRVIGSVGTYGSARKVVIVTSKRKVIVYDPSLETLETILAIREAHSSYQTEECALRVSLFQETLVPVCQTNEEMTLSNPLTKAFWEILCRLPADYTVQSKLVCKEWLRLIENKTFTHSYYSHRNMDQKPKIMLVGKGLGGSGFCFTPLNKLLAHTPNKDMWLDTKIVCSKPCHGMNLVSTETEDYLYNPCTGYRSVYLTRRPVITGSWNTSGYDYVLEDHAFSLGSRNVGLGFNLLSQHHVIFKFFYHQKDFKSREYLLIGSFINCGIGHAGNKFYPPLPVNDMPPAYLLGVLYWMSEPRLGRSYERAIVSFDVVTKMFDVISCPSCIAKWNRNPFLAFAVELDGMLCAVLANPVAEELDIWKLENGLWYQAYKVYLKGWSGYSLVTNVVVPLAVDPKNGRIMLSTGRKIGLYDPTRHFIESLYDIDKVTHMQKPPLKQHNIFKKPSPALSVKNYASSSAMQYSEEKDPSYSVLPLVPMLYNESLTRYPRVCNPRIFRR